MTLGSGAFHLAYAVCLLLWTCVMSLNYKFLCLFPLGSMHILEETMHRANDAVGMLIEWGYWGSDGNGAIKPRELSSI